MLERFPKYSMGFIWPDISLTGIPEKDWHLNIMIAWFVFVAKLALATCFINHEVIPVIGMYPITTKKNWSGSSSVKDRKNKASKSTEWLLHIQGWISSIVLFLVQMWALCFLCNNVANYPWSKKNLQCPLVWWNDVKINCLK